MGSGVFFGLWEWLAMPLYIFLALILAYRHQKQKMDKEPIYRFYSWGLFARIMGGVFLGCIYEYYYSGGDTFGYYLGSVCMNKLLLYSPFDWLKVEFGACNDINYNLFNNQTGYPLIYMYFDPRTFMVIRLVNLFILPAFGSYLLGTVLMAIFCYIGIWKMFLVFCKHYPRLERELAIAILFFPSVLFWGSGILKDTITLSSTGWIIYCIYQVFMIKRKVLLHVLLLLINIYFVLIIKPYIIFALVPGSFMWIFSQRIYAIKNMAARFLIIPLIVLVSGVAGYYVLSQLESVMGKFALQKVIKTAAVTQNDLKQSYYMGHSFDIGLKDASISGYIQKSPQAFVAGIYRPFLWECQNIVMVLSGLENTAILLLTIFLFWKTSIIPNIRRIFAEPLLFFSFSYSVFFAAIVGLTTANFGALTRFKIAYISLFMASIFILLKKPAGDEETEAEES